MKKINYLLLLLLQLQNIEAIDFKYRSKVDSVSKPGFYKIALSPEIISSLSDDYSDLRIFDSKHNEIPYILLAEDRTTERTGFKEYQLLENNYLPKQKTTRVVVHNSDKRILSSLNLIVRNSDIEKEISLKGSDDLKHWYIIKRSFTVQSTEINGESSKIIVLEFPKSNYEYFELAFNDKYKDPLQIIKVGFYESEVAKGLYTVIPNPSIKQLDSSEVKRSYITLKFDRFYEISKLEVRFNGPDLFMRHCNVGKFNIYQKKPVFEEITQFIAYSKQPIICEFEKIRVKELVITIENLDNSPLSVNQVKAFQLNKYLIVNLKPNEEYYLFFGKSKLGAPIYDLIYFRDSIPKNISVIKTSNFIILEQSRAKTKFVFFTKYILWGVIVIIITLLSWFTIRLVNDLGKK